MSSRPSATSSNRMLGLLFLTHPGPSLLVTATFVATAALASPAPPPPAALAGLILIMLPAQATIGIVNDLADRDADALGQPRKPLVRGTVGPMTAAALAVILACTALLAAAAHGPATFGLAATGLLAGIAYDAGLGRTPLSVIPWWVGLAALPLTAFSITGGVTRPLVAVTVPLTGCLALGLHGANALPDLAGDLRVGSRSLPVTVGPEWTRRISIAGLAGAAMIGAGAAAASGRDLRDVGIAAACLPAVLTCRPRPSFPISAVWSAGSAMAWLAVIR